MPQDDDDFIERIGYDKREILNQWPKDDLVGLLFDVLSQRKFSKERSLIYCLILYLLMSYSKNVMTMN